MGLKGEQGGKHQMRKPLVGGLLLAAALGVGVAAVGLRPNHAAASSHSEAPLISQDPTADNTDLYAFVSPDKPDTVTIIANWIPKEDPANGPNFYRFSDTARYDINIDNTGTPEEDVSFQFRFTTHYRTPGSFLYTTGIVNHISDPTLNQYQTYDITKRWMVHGRWTSKVIAHDLPVAPANVGPRSMPDYATLASEAVRPLGHDGQVFAGPRDDPFFVDLGAIFDLATIRSGLGTSGGGLDTLKGLNVHTIALQLPINALVLKRPTIGIYASTDRQKITVLNSDGTVTTSRRWVQVSRLGNPLFNEVITPVGKKDYWNSTDPADDHQFETYVLNPELAADLNLLYGPSGIVAHVFDPPLAEHNRTDLRAILLTGVPGLNYTGKHEADLLRLNTSIKPDNPACTGNRMGVLAGDLCGYPNGRRLSDDVIDIDEQAIAVVHPGDELSGNQYKIGDGVDANDAPFLTTFPYAAPPWDGFSELPHGVDS
jgi:hypothetical protein